MKLGELIKPIRIIQVIGTCETEIKAVNIDSRQVETGDLFMAMKGTQTDGHAYISTAIEKGAVAILCEVLPETLSDKITYIQILWGSYLKIKTGGSNWNKWENNYCHLII